MHDMGTDIGRCVVRWLQLVGVVLALAAASTPAHAEVRPLVREMLENLASLDEIGAGVSVGDFERVKRAAAGLDARAGALVGFDVTRLGVAAQRGPEGPGRRAGLQERAGPLETRLHRLPRGLP